MPPIFEILTQSAADAKLEGTLKIGAWITQILAAGIMGQTLFFKFTAAPESVFIFSTLGVEPWGRLLTGGLELVAVVLLFSPSFALLGSLLGSALMLGALMSHILFLGVNVQDDGGLLFILASVTLAACLANLLIRQNQIALVLRALRNSL